MRRPFGLVRRAIRIVGRWWQYAADHRQRRDVVRLLNYLGSPRERRRQFVRRGWRVIPRVMGGNPGITLAADRALVTGTTSVTVNNLGTVTQGDLIVLLITSYGANTIAANGSPATTYTKVDGADAVQGSIHTAIYYKIAGASETSPAFTGGATRMTGHAVIFHSDTGFPASPLDVSGTQLQSSAVTTTTIAASSNPTVAGGVAIAIGQWFASTARTFTTTYGDANLDSVTGLTDDDGTSLSQHHLPAYGLVTAADQTTSISLTSGTRSGTWASKIAVFKPTTITTGYSDAGLRARVVSGSQWPVVSQVANEAATTSVDVTTGAIQEGDVIIAFGHGNNADPASPQISDDHSTVYSHGPVVDGMGGLSSGRIWISYGVAPSTAAGGYVVTAHAAPGASRAHIVVYVLRLPPGYNGFSSLEFKTNFYTTAGTTWESGDSSASAQPGDLLIGGVVNATGSALVDFNAPYLEGANGTDYLNAAKVDDFSGSGVQNFTGYSEFTAGFAVILAIFRPSSGTTGYRDLTLRARVVAQRIRDAALRVRVAVQGIRDATLRARVVGQTFRDGTVRVRLRAWAFRDQAIRVRVAVQGFRDRTLRVGLRAQSFRDASIRARVAATAFRDGVLRAVVRGQSIRDAALRVRVVIPGVAFRDGTLRIRLQATSLRDATLRARVAIQGFRERTLRVRVLGQSIRDAAVRVRIAVQGFRDAPLRGRVAVQVIRDGAIRVRLRAWAFRDGTLRAIVTVPGLAWRDGLLRIRVRAQTIRDATLRAGLVAQRFRDATLRARIRIQSFRDLALRVRLRAQTIRDATLRASVFPQTFRERTLRVRLRAQAFRDGALRIQVQGFAWRNLALRARLVGQRWRDGALRIRVRAQSFRDASLRIGLRALGVRDADLRARLVAAGWRDAVLRISLYGGLGYRDVGLRVILVARKVVMAAELAPSGWSIGQPGSGWDIADPESGWSVEVAP